LYNFKIVSVDLFALLLLLYYTLLLLFCRLSTVARMGEVRGVHRVFMGKPEGKRPVGRVGRRGGGNIKKDLQEVGGVHGDWMELAQERDR
jgi:hypothetical protein